MILSLFTYFLFRATTVYSLHLCKNFYLLSIRLSVLRRLSPTIFLCGPFQTLAEEKTFIERMSFLFQRTTTTSPPRRRHTDPGRSVGGSSSGNYPRSSRVFRSAVEKNHGVRFFTCFVSDGLKLFTEIILPFFGWLDWFLLSFVFITHPAPFSVTSLVFFVEVCNSLSILFDVLDRSFLSYVIFVQSLILTQESLTFFFCVILVFEVDFLIFCLNSSIKYFLLFSVPHFFKTRSQLLSFVSFIFSLIITVYFTLVEGIYFLHSEV